MGHLIIQGDCIEQMRLMNAASADAIVTDPPYELAFMGKRWDASGIAYNVEMWGECLRVLKPGGHLLSFGGTRTQHRMVCAIEDAGFEIRDSIHWVYGSGFPKSLDVGKAIDKAAGAQRERLGRKDELGVIHSMGRANETRHEGWRYACLGDPNAEMHFVTAPATDAAKQWDGWGTALKPAHEPIVVARKPFSCGVAQNVETWGTGALNVDGCRIETTDSLGGGAEKRVAVEGKHEGWARPWMHDSTAVEAHAERIRANVVKAQSLGRWPTNLVLSHSDCEEACADDCAVQEMDRQSGVSAGKANRQSDERAHAHNRIYGDGRGWRRHDPLNSYTDSDGASRFFPVFRYVPKASSRERTLPDGTRSNHPTVKPLALMRWLVRLVTPPGGVILDPFAGSGTTLVAALEEGLHPIGIEQSAEYCELIRARCDAVQPRLVEVSA